VAIYLKKKISDKIKKGETLAIFHTDGNKNKTNEAAGLFIPSRAVLVDEQGDNFVYVVDNNKAVRKYVKTGKLLKNGVEITEGLNDGEQIVVAGQQKLVDNSSIRIVNR